MTLRGRASRLIAVVFLAAISLCVPAGATTPAQIFANDSSGMVKIEASCPGGPQQGSGFLLGSRVVLTARHVLVDEQGRSCTGSVTQAATGVSARIVRWMAIQVKRFNAPTDLAVAILGSPLKGHDFSLSRASPKPGQLLIALGYALGQPLSLNQGHVEQLVTRDGVRVIEMRLLEAPGASGGPILDTRGDVVGLTQFGNENQLAAVDIPALIGGDPRQLCIGIASGEPSTVCAATRSKTFVLEQGGPPQLCAGFAIDAPFETCPKFASDGLGLLSISAKCPKAGSWSGAGFLLGPRLMMTARQTLIDPDTAQACTATVTQTLTGKTTRITSWTALQTVSGESSTDVATAVLATPMKGYSFSLSSTPPKIGDHGFVLTPSLPLPTTYGAARVTKVISATEVPGGAPIPEFAMSTTSWVGGAPIVNAQNEVIGIEQVGNSTTVWSVNLADLTNGDPTQFCVGNAVDQRSTICPRRHGSSLPRLMADISPQVCDGNASDPPFSACMSAPSTTTSAPTTTTFVSSSELTGLSMQFVFPAQNITPTFGVPPCPGEEITGTPSTDQAVTSPVTTLTPYASITTLTPSTQGWKASLSGTLPFGYPGDVMALGNFVETASDGAPDGIQTQPFFLVGPDGTTVLVAISIRYPQTPCGQAITSAFFTQETWPEGQYTPISLGRAALTFAQNAAGDWVVTASL